MKQMNTEKTKPALSRDFSLDIARTIGTMLIILAHVGAPNMINEIRCFDVVLLVFVSGYCINYSNYGRYLWKRFKRLVVPAWLLLVILFCATWVACLFVNKEQIYNVEKITKSFFFINGGIGFIWIVRIYLGIAFLTPLIVWVNKTIKSNVAILIITTSFIILNAAIARRFVAGNNTSIVYYIVEIFAYSAVALIGYRYKQLRANDGTNHSRYGFALLSIAGVGCIVVFSLLKFQPNEYKYPPMEPYLFYGLFVTTLIFLIINRFYVSDDRAIERAICKFSILSYDTYLVHIFVLSIFDMLEEMINKTIDWGIKYFFVLIISLLGSIILDRIKKQLKKKFMRE